MKIEEITEGWYEIPMAEDMEPEIYYVYVTHIEKDNVHYSHSSYKEWKIEENDSFIASQEWVENMRHFAAPFDIDDVADKVIERMERKEQKRLLIKQILERK